MRLRWVMIVLAVVLIIVHSAWAASQADDERSASLLPDALLRNIGTDGPGTPIVVFNPLSGRERTPSR